MRLRRLGILLDIPLQRGRFTMSSQTRGGLFRRRRTEMIKAEAMSRNTGAHVSHSYIRTDRSSPTAAATAGSLLNVDSRSTRRYALRLQELKHIPNPPAGEIRNGRPSRSVCAKIPARENPLSSSLDSFAILRLAPASRLALFSKLRRTKIIQRVSDCQ